jgi:hypothetical protein
MNPNLGDGFFLTLFEILFFDFADSGKLEK